MSTPLPKYINPVLAQITAGGGEMGEITRSYNWATSAVGPVDSWPQSLKTALSIILHSKFPMFLFWGKHLTCFYNDAYRPSLGNNGKHPSALGMPGEQVWPEIWPDIKPLIDQVLAGGEASWSEDQLLPIYRNGKMEDVYWTFSYSSVMDESGKASGVFVTCSETTAKIRNMGALVESRDFLEFAIDAAELGVWDYNPATNKFTGNERLKEWFGLEPDAEIDLSHAIAVMAPHDQERVSHAIQNALIYGSGGSYDIEYNIINPKTGFERIVRAKGKAWFGTDQIAYRFNGTLQDVTDQVTAKRQLKEFADELSRQVTERTKELQRSNEDLLQFAHVTSHDLKEPIRKIRIFASRIQEELHTSIPEKGVKYLEKIQNASARVMSMIEGVLAYSELTNARPEIEKIDLNLILDNVESDLEILIQEKNAIIQRDSLPHIDGTSVLIYQLFYNILNNALKFSKAGENPQISITCHETGLPQPDVVIAVKDNGIGFENEYQSRIFTTFARLNSKDAYEGTGLGLALCKKIVERHHGTISASGEADHGAIFTITLPVKQPVQVI